MNPIRRIPRDEWGAQLKSYGCYPAAGMGSLQTAEFWRWPWGGYPFTAPCDADGFMDMWAFQRLLSDMAALAPADWVFLTDV